MSIKVVFLKKEYERAAAAVDLEFFQFDPKKKRPWLAVYLKETKMTVFCPLHTVKEYTENFKKKYGEAIIEVDNRQKGKGVLDFRKCFVADWKEDFYDATETSYPWQKSKTKEIYKKAELLLAASLSHLPDRDVRHLSLHRQAMERMKKSE